jgi:hypothetical protein
MFRLNTKRKSFIWSLVFLWGFYFFFSPFLHFHPTDVHTHDGELQSHQHEGHFHSEELEALAHSWNFHPGDDQQDQEKHHSHSSPEHDSDTYDLNIENAGLKYEYHVQTFQHIQLSFYSNIPPFERKEISLFIQSDTPPLYYYDTFLERSPPVLYQFII